MKIFTIPKICPICGVDTKIVVSDSGVENLICDNPQISKAEKFISSNE